MFKNIGGKIKALALIISGFGMVFSIVYAIVLIKDDLLKVGVNAVILIAVISLISSFILYGFGQLIENSDKLVKMKEDELEKKQKVETKEELIEKEAKVSKTVKKDDKKILKNISPTLKEKIKKIVITGKGKFESIKEEKEAWVEEIKSLTDKELVDRIDNDYSWQYSYVILCCYEYNKRVKGK